MKLSNHEILRYFFLIIFTLNISLLHAQNHGDKTSLLSLNMDSLQHALEQQRIQNVKQIKSSKIQYLISKVENKGFGYFIFIDGHLIVDQKNIPAISGNHAFYSSEDAEKVALLMIEKIKQGYLPPTITEKEIKELKITYPSKY